MPAELPPGRDRIVEVHQDVRRAYPRVQVGLQVSLDADCDRVHSRTHDIGRGGFQVRCDRDTAARIAPDQAATKVERTARLTLALGDVEQPIEMRCRIAHVSLIGDANGADAAVAMGFSFTAMGDPEQRALEQFIVAHLRPANT